MLALFVSCFLQASIALRKLRCVGLLAEVWGLVLPVPECRCAMSWLSWNAFVMGEASSSECLSTKSLNYD